jgi:DNA-directed RNA polymerase subunit RPC12/RpoP
MKCSQCGKEITNEGLIDIETLYDEILCKECAKNNFLRRG